MCEVINLMRTSKLKIIVEKSGGGGDLNTFAVKKIKYDLFLCRPSLAE